MQCGSCLSGRIDLREREVGRGAVVRDLEVVLHVDALSAEGFDERQGVLLDERLPERVFGHPGEDALLDLVALLDRLLRARLGQDRERHAAGIREAERSEARLVADTIHAEAGLLLQLAEDDHLQRLARIGHAGREAGLTDVERRELGAADAHEQVAPAVLVVAPADRHRTVGELEARVLLPLDFLLAESSVLHGVHRLLVGAPLTAGREEAGLRGAQLHRLEAAVGVDEDDLVHALAGVERPRRDVQTAEEAVLQLLPRVAVGLLLRRGDLLGLGDVGLDLGEDGREVDVLGRGRRVVGHGGLLRVGD
jgi:hypothetical protein